MAEHLERPRNGCALHGALQTLEAIEGVVPIIHATAGCGVQHYLGGVRGSGSSLPGVAGGVPLSSTNISEKHVVFGGSSRLREQLKNTVKLVRGDLYVAVSGCATEMVGDDIPAMVKEGREQGWPVIHASTPGFRGGAHQGYRLAVRALIEQLPALPAATSVKVATQPLINLWGVVPQQDLFWRGNLKELTRLFAAIGVDLNPLFGASQGIAAWRQVPQAALNLVVSPWGREAALLLEEKYGSPWLEWPGLPIGATTTGALLTAVGDRLALDSKQVASVRSEEEAGFTRALMCFADHYFSTGFQREFALIGETALVVGLSEFLIGTLGLVPRLAIITDAPPEAQRDSIAARLGELFAPCAAPVVFSEEGGEITDRVAGSGAELVIGSRLEAEAAATLGAPLLELSFPVGRRLILDRPLAGYTGALSLIEDLTSLLLTNHQDDGDLIMRPYADLQR